MHLPQFIHITGASGAGTSTLGRALEEKHDYKWLDSDDFFWMPTDPPFTHRRPAEECVSLLYEAIRRHPRCVISGSLCGWGDGFLPAFELIVWLQTSTMLRRERLRQREYARFGNRILSGGDMHEDHLAFIDWAGRYDGGDESMRSHAMHEQWLRGATCPVMILDGAQPLEALIKALVSSQ